jgi:hypothetical protein
MLLLADYIDGVAPPVPSLDLEIETGIFHRYDSKTDIEAWVFSMNRVAWWTAAAQWARSTPQVA